MREILFRGKTRKGKWVMGALSHLNEPCFIRDETANGDEILVYPITIGQYTGLKDKNGIKIFEGDVLRYDPDHRDCIRFDVVVADEWNCGCCNGVFGFSTKNGWIDLQTHEDCEVISNIYDNPEYDDYEIMRTKNEKL